MTRRYPAARRRGFHPESEPPILLSPSVDVTIRLDRDLYRWLAGMVGANSFTFCVEEAITTALRCMRGNEGMGLAGLVGLMASERGVSPVEALFARTADDESEQAAALLLQAAAIAAGGVPVLELDDRPDDERSDLLRVLQAAFPGCDLEQDLAAERADLARMDDEQAKERAGEPRAPRAKNCLDDDIPF